MSREKMEFDVLIIGAGPAGLSTAIRLKQLALQHQKDLSICVIEKGAEVGAHTLSGAVIEPRALDELVPDWREKGAPLNTAVSQDKFIYLTKKYAIRLPTPRPMRNHGNYIISLGKLCRWLAQIAEQMAISIFPGFAATEILYNQNDEVIGILTGDMGINKQGQPTANYQPGVELLAKQTVFAEGCRGSLSAELMQHYHLRQTADPQTYGIGIKELWEVNSADYQPGKVMHTIGWPLDHHTYGGSFIYHLDNNLVSVGFVIGLDYENPWLNPFEEMQRFKTHPAIVTLFKGGKRIEYGARALNEGGLQSLPKLTFPGGLLIGDCAGFLNVPKIKGTHTAIKSGMVAAECIFTTLTQPSTIDSTAYVPQEITEYPKQLKNSWVWQELQQVRNIRPAFRWGLWPGLIYAAIDTYIFRGKAPWTLHHQKPDHAHLTQAALAKKINYPKPDGQITFDKLSSVYLSNTHHNEDQPCHLKLRDAEIPIKINLALYDAPEQRYCPANVYEIIYTDKNEPRLQINAANCIHCKTCDIKDPKQNIVWVPPEGGGGPNYLNM